MKHVSVVIPNYNGRHLMEKHLPSVLQMLHEEDEIVIVDDASTDDSVEYLLKKFSLTEQATTVDGTKMWVGEWQQNNESGQIILLQNFENQRFGESCNRGVRAAHQPLIFLMNTDVSPTSQVLDSLLPHFEDPTVFGVGCLEKEQHNGEEVEGGKNKLWFERGLFTHSRADDFRTGETAWITGGSGMIDRQKWIELGGFDVSFKPAYWEDIDLSYRAHQKGWKVLFDSQAIVYHNHESTNATAFGRQQMETMSIKNSLNFLWLRGSLSQKLQHLFWLPYHILITNAKMNGAFIKGYGAYLASRK
jgi:GT2 family glycosyltransferase